MDDWLAWNLRRFKIKLKGNKTKIYNLLNACVARMSWVLFASAYFKSDLILMENPQNLILFDRKLRFYFINSVFYYFIIHYITLPWEHTFHTETLDWQRFKLNQMYAFLWTTTKESHSKSNSLYIVWPQEFQAKVWSGVECMLLRLIKTNTLK